MNGNAILGCRTSMASAWLGASVRRLLLVLLSGGLLVLSLPPYRFGALAWLALLPLLQLRRELRGSWLLAASWLAITMPVSSLAYMFGLPRLGVRYFVAASVGASLVFAIGVVTAAWIEDRAPSALRVFVFPTVAAAIDLTLRWLLRDLPVVPSLAWSQPEHGALVQVGYALQSPAPVTFIIVLANVGLDELVLVAHGWLAQGRPHLRHLASIGTVTVLLIANTAFGIHRLATQAQTAAALTAGEIKAPPAPLDRSAPSGIADEHGDLTNDRTTTAPRARTTE